MRIRDTEEKINYRKKKKNMGMTQPNQEDEPVRELHIRWTNKTTRRTVVKAPPWPPTAQISRSGSPLPALPAPLPNLRVEALKNVGIFMLRRAGIPPRGLCLPPADGRRGNLAAREGGYGPSLRWPRLCDKRA